MDKLRENGTVFSQIASEFIKADGDYRYYTDAIPEAVETALQNATRREAP